MLFICISVLLSLPRMDPLPDDENTDVNYGQNGGKAHDFDRLFGLTPEDAQYDYGDAGQDGDLDKPVNIEVDF